MKNQIQKFKKRIFRVVFTLIAVFSVFAFLNTNNVPVVKAKKAKEATDEKKLPTCVLDNYDLGVDFDDTQSNTSNGLRNVYHIISSRGTFVLKSVGEMASVTKDDKGNLWYTTSPTDATDWVTTWRPNAAGVEEAKKNMTPKKPLLYVTIHSNKVKNPPQNVVLTFELTKDAKCEPPKDAKDSNGKVISEPIRLQVVLPMDDVVADTEKSSKKMLKNKYIGTVKDEDKVERLGLCTILSGIEEQPGIIRPVSLDEISKDQRADYTDELDKITKTDLAKFDANLINTVYRVYFPYCFDNNVAKNYSKKKVRKKIKAALNAGVTYSTVLTPTYTESFNTAFNNTKFKAGGKINSDGTGSEIGCATTLQAGQQAGHCFNLNTNASALGTNDSPISLMCNKNTTSSYRTQAGYNFENNVSYYAFKKSDAVKVNYSYYKTGSTWEDELGRTEKDNGVVDAYNTEKTLCSKICEEAVEVEYGPPVIAKAGRCFEYRVRVTSRIKCETKVDETAKPAIKPTVCSPAPVCVHIGRRGTARGAGPTEDFEACIQNCDGGKYTQKCSTKCYDEVYNNDSANKLAVNYEQKVVKLTNTETDENGILVTKADLGKRKMDGKSVTYNDAWNLDEAYYLVDNNGGITYHYGFALWYYFNQKTQTENQFAENLQSYGKSGFFEHQGARRMLHNGYNCTATCRYVSCGVGYYNEADAEADLEDNQAEYFSKLRECQVQSTCTTKDASFSMSTQYNDKTIYYPGPTDKEGNSVHSNQDTEPQQVPTLKYCEKGQTGGTCADNSVVYDYAGCYKTIKSEKDTNGNSYADRFYQTEITYPGTWINDKRQEISYKKPQSTTGWTLEKQQFCLPTNANDVNREWWLWYIQQTSKTGQYEYENEYGQKCLNSTSSSSSAGNISSLNVTPNIFANIRNFGHFGWYFNVQCFYALDNDPSNDNSNNNTAKSTNEKCDTDPYNYRVRSVDLTNLFPGSDGTGTRTPGFNWTSAATLNKATTVNGTSYYNVDPTKVVTAIQERGNKIFDDDSNYLDYWFHLDQTALNLLRNYNKQRNGYNDFAGDFYTDTDTYGFTRYKSNLFNYSGSGNILGNVNSKYVKAVGNLQCNNDGVNGECETFK